MDDIIFSNYRKIMLKRAIKEIKKRLLRNIRIKKPSPVTQSTQIVIHLEVVEDSFSWLKSNKKQVTNSVCLRE